MTNSKKWGILLLVLSLLALCAAGAVTALIDPFSITTLRWMVCSTPSTTSGIRMMALCGILITMPLLQELP